MKSMKSKPLSALWYGPRPDYCSDMEVHQNYDRETDTSTYTIPTKPYLIAVADRFCLRSQCVEEFQPFPESLGYRLVKRVPEQQLSFYARPLLLWLVLRAREKLFSAFWRVVGKTYGKFWHSVTPDGQRMRWRDVRLGPEPKGIDFGEFARDLLENKEPMVDEDGNIKPFVATSIDEETKE